MADICHHSVSLLVFSHPVDRGKEGNLFQFPPLSLSFFASSDSELLVIHPCMQKVCLCSVCPFPISHEKSTSCLTARGRERRPIFSLSLFEIFKSAADQTIPFANVHLVTWYGSIFQPNPTHPSFKMFEAAPCLIHMCLWSEFHQPLSLASLPPQVVSGLRTEQTNILPLSLGLQTFRNRFCSLFCSAHL